MLTMKEQAFCQAYSETGNAVAAYRRAFQSSRLKPATIARRAAAFLVREDIAGRLAELGRTDQGRARAPGLWDEAAGASAATAIDRDWVLRHLVLNVERALQLAPTRERASAGTSLAYNGAVANRALELIGKELGMFVDRREVRTGPLADRTDDELNDLIRRLLEEAGFARSSPGGWSAEPDDGPSTLRRAQGSGPDAAAP